MKLLQIRVHGFRLLQDVTIDASDITTVLVGRNNCGKTSLVEAVNRFVNGRTGFAIEDFSAAGLAALVEVAKAHKGTLETRESMPTITMELRIGYEASESLGPLSPFVIDLDPACTTAVIRFEYRLKDGAAESFLGSTEADVDEEILASLASELKSNFEIVTYAVDSADPTNLRLVDMAVVRRLVCVDVLAAHRGLDDEKGSRSNRLGSALEDLYRSATKEEAGSTRRQVADKLATAISKTQTEVSKSVQQTLRDLLPRVEDLGYPGLLDQELEAVSEFDAAKLLSDFTKVRYKSDLGMTLPESHSGLGSRNLLMIAFRLFGFTESFKTRGDLPGIHLVFIEEPEAHLHPQMQEAFIKNGALTGQSDSPTQFFITTHSSHIVSQAHFEQVRYFKRSSPSEVATTEVLDLTKVAKKNKPNSEFLQKYLTLTRADLFFADKAILVEGVSERLILPRAIEIGSKTNQPCGNLSTEYVTILEVGGAFAHRFFDLVRFIGLPTLVVTDLDAVGLKSAKEGAQRTKATASNGDRTSNGCIKAWFEPKMGSDIELEQIMKAAGDEELLVQDNVRIAYQTPEMTGNGCGRTFEDAFILANRLLFDLDEELTNGGAEAKAKRIGDSQKKSDFALKYSIEITDWVVPKYILDGLNWLADPTSMGTGPDA